MFLKCDCLVELFFTRDFFEELRPSNQKFASKTARIESLYQQLEQSRICYEKFEEQTA